MSTVERKVIRSGRGIPRRLPSTRETSILPSALLEDLLVRQLRRTRAHQVPETRVLGAIRSVTTAAPVARIHLRAVGVAGGCERRRGRGIRIAGVGVQRWPVRGVAWVHVDVLRGILPWLVVVGLAVGVLLRGGERGGRGVGESGAGGGVGGGIRPGGRVREGLVVVRRLGDAGLGEGGIRGGGVGGGSSGDARRGADTLVQSVREVELRAQPSELFGGFVIRLRCFLRRVVGAEPDARCFLGVANLRRPFAPGALPHSSVLALLGELGGAVARGRRSALAGGRSKALALLVPAPLHLQLCERERGTMKTKNQERKISNALTPGQQSHIAISDRDLQRIVIQL